MFEFEDYLAKLREDYPDFAADFAGFHGIEDVLQWMSRRVVDTSVHDWDGLLNTP